MYNVTCYTPIRIEGGREGKKEKGGRVRREGKGGKGGVGLREGGREGGREGDTEPSYSK